MKIKEIYEHKFYSWVPVRDWTIVLKDRKVFFAKYRNTGFWISRRDMSAGMSFPYGKKPKELTLSEVTEYTEELLEYLVNHKYPKPSGA